MTRQIEPLISEKDPFLLYENSIPLNSKIDLTKRLSSSIYLPEQQPLPTKVKRETPTNWEDTLAICIKSIVSIKSCRVRGLDTEIPGSFTATGFVVDPIKGLLLSNRHVVSVSPVTAYAILCNYEEIELKPVYRDPIHDFGFFQYDPSKVKFLQIPGIELYPEGAKIGQDIRVVGNDAGEKLSILSGTLARLDREAPNYGTGEYNDFNTFYYQAASGTSSGSSGSPVLDLQGRAIALNAGGAQTSSSSYYFPLERVQRALTFLQNNEKIKRGTLQTKFEYMSFDGLARLGLSPYIEKRLRIHSKKLNFVNEGLLIVRSVLPDGPAFNLLEPGDILLTCNGHLLPRLFIDLEEYIDTALKYKSPISLVVSRAGELKEFSLIVQDLHLITPYRFLEFGDGILNDLSYQMAMSYGLSLKNPGVYVGKAGFMLGTALALRGSVIVSINNRPVGSLDDFISIVKKIAQGERIPVRYYSISKPTKTKIMVFLMDWRWHKFRIAIRNDRSGIWDYTTIKTLLNTSIDPIETSFHFIEDQENSISSLKDLEKSIVSVDCYPPFVIDGLKNSHSYGTGVIVSVNPPLILCDRDTVPVGICVISVTFENSLTISADLLFLHPFYNYAILKFDPTPVLKAGIELKAATLDDSYDFIIEDTVNYVGLSGRNEVNSKRTKITTLAPIRTNESFPPRWRATNLEVFKVSDGNLASQGGVLADDEGKVRAIWMSFSTGNEKREQSSILGGLPSKLVLPVVNKIKENKPIVIKGLDVEFWTLQISNARLLGVSHKWIEKLKEKSHQPFVLYILNITNISSSSGKLLKSGDIVLSINDKILTSISDLIQFSENDLLDMKIIRDGQEQKLFVPTTHFDGKETTEVVGWQGMLIQNTYASAKEQARKNIPEGVYISCCLFGSPAQANLKPGVWITEIDQIPVKTLDMFLKIVDPESINEHQKIKLNLQKSSNNENILKNQGRDALNLLISPTRKEIEEMSILCNELYLQIKFVTADNVTHIRAMKIDKHYWPTWHILKNENSALGWEMSFLS